MTDDDAKVVADIVKKTLKDIDVLLTRNVELLKVMVGDDPQFATIIVFYLCCIGQSFLRELSFVLQLKKDQLGLLTAALFVAQASGDNNLQATLLRSKKLAEQILS